MRLCSLALLATILIISCGSSGCDFITGKDSEANPVDDQYTSPVPITDQDIESSNTEYEVTKGIDTEATHAEVTIYTDSDWEPLFSMPKLTSLIVHINRYLSSIDDLTPLSELKNLTSLTLDYHGDDLANITAISSLTNLTSLNLHASPATIHEPPFDLSWLEPLTNLTSLSIETSRATNIQAVSSLDNLSSLELIIPKVRINQITCDAINSLGNLTALKIECYYLSISRLTNLTKLVSLDLSYTLIADLTPIASFENLVELNLEDNNIIDITPLSSLTKLTSLNLQDNSIVDITPLSSLNNLTSLNLQMNSINDVSPLASLSHLTSLTVSWNEIEDISPLASLQNLKTLWLGSNQIESISELDSLPDLQELLLDGNPLDYNSAYEVIPQLTRQGVAVYWWHAEKDDWLIPLILTTRLDQGQYHMIHPEMSLSGLGATQAASTSFGTSKAHIIESFKEQGYDLTTLIEALIHRNQTPEKMAIPSSPDDGYIIDYDGYFMSYFKDDPDFNAWERLREENPGARCFITISLPAYDPKTGIVVVYLGWQSDWLTGEGCIYALRYNGNRLEEIASIRLWIS